MAQGMFRAAIALRQLGCIVLPDAPFNTGAQAGGTGRGFALCCSGCMHHAGHNHAAD